MTANGAVILRLRGQVPEIVKEFKQGRDVSEWARKIWELDKYFVVEMLEASEPEERELARYVVLQGPDIPRDWNNRERAKILAIDAQIKTLVAYIEACEKAPGVIRGGLISDMKYKVKVLQKVACHFDSIRGQFVLKGKWTDVELRANRAAGRNISPDPEDQEDQEGPQAPRTEPMTEDELNQALQELEAGAMQGQPGFTAGFLSSFNSVGPELEAEVTPEEPRKTLANLEELVEQFRPAITALAGSMNQLVEGVKQAVQAEVPPAILPHELMTPGRHYPQSPFIDQNLEAGRARRPYRRKGETIDQALARQAAKEAAPPRQKRPYHKKQKAVFVEVTRDQDPTETN